MENLAFTKTERCAWKKLDDEKVVLLDLDAGHYYTLSRSASVAWELLAASVSAQDAVHLYTKVFELDSKQASEDINGLITRFREMGFIAPSPLAVAAPMEHEPMEYEPPDVEEHAAVNEVTAGSEGGGGSYSTYVSYQYPN